MKKELKIACTEINELLQYFPQEYKDSIPRKMKDFLKENEDVNHKIQIDLNKKLEEQNLTSETKTLLILIYRNYWATEERKKDLDKIFMENDEKYEEELRQKYNPDQIFGKIDCEKRDIFVESDEYDEKKTKNILKKESFIAIIESLKVKLLKPKDKN